MFSEKLTRERKEQVKLIMCNFIDNLAEDDELIHSGKSQRDIITGEGKIEYFLSAKKTITKNTKNESEN